MWMLSCVALGGWCLACANTIHVGLYLTGLLRRSIVVNDSDGHADKRTKPRNLRLSHEMASR